MLASRIMMSAIIVGSVGMASIAHAQEERRSYFREQVPTRSNAFELTVGTGYTQGFGSLQQGVDVPDVMNAGIAVELGLGYRIDRRFSIGLDGQYQEFDPDRASGVRGMTAGVDAAFHFAPEMRTDPWLQLATGYRALWETQDQTPNVLTHGLRLARLVGGVDLRVSPDVALGPAIGADLSMFVWQRPEGGSNESIDNPRLSTFVFGGLQGRFDIGGRTERPARLVGGR